MTATSRANAKNSDKDNTSSSSPLLDEDDHRPTRRSSRKAVVGNGQAATTTTLPLGPSAKANQQVPSVAGAIKDKASAASSNGTPLGPSPTATSPNLAVAASAEATSPTSGRSASNDDAFARAQAMGLRLTREEFEKSRAGVAAFLKAERVGPSSAATSSAPSAATGTRAITPLAEQRSPDPSTSSYGARPSGSLSFFTAIVAPEPAAAARAPRPRLEDLGNAQEKKLQKEKRRRRREKAALMSEPESTPKTSYQPSPSSVTLSGSSSRRNTAASASSPVVGLGLSSSEASSSASKSGGKRRIPGGTLASDTPETSPLASFPRGEPLRRRGRAHSDNAAITASCDLQAATGRVVQGAAIAGPSSPRRTSPGLQRLTSHAWLSPTGELKLVTATTDNNPSSPVKLLPAVLADDSGIVMEDSVEGYTAPASGFRGASETGWGIKLEADSTTTKLSLLDRVMKDKKSPRRLRREAKQRAQSQGLADLVEVTSAERDALEIAAQNSHIRQYPIQATYPPMPLAPSAQINEAMRRRTHSRQLSQANKSVRWAVPSTSLAVAHHSPVHERMTTKEHYEYFLHGIAPGFHGLSELEVESHGSALMATPAHAHTAMPWLFTSGGASGGSRSSGMQYTNDSPGPASSFRRPSSVVFGSPMGRRSGQFNHEDLATVELSAVPHPVDEDHEEARSNFLQARRGLLFGNDPSTMVQSSPARVINRFNPGFSDPALSQSPQRGPVARRSHHRATASKGSIGSIRDLFGGGMAYPPQAMHQPLHHSSPAVPQGRVGRHQRQPTQTISPAAIFGGQLPYSQQVGRVAAMAIPAAPHSQPLPEPTKHWGSHGQQGNQEKAASIGPDEESASLLVGRSLQRSTSAMAGLEPPTSKAPATTSGLARVRSEGTMDWGVLAPSSSTDVAAAAAMPSVKGEDPGSSQSRAADRKPAQKKDKVATAALAIASFTPSLPLLPPNADPTATEWDRSDGSRVVKLISEELQAALDAGEVEEPPPRYYVLPPGWGSTKSKPAHVSYAGLIGQAILTSSDMRLSLAEVYNWISTVHPFFERGDRGWQNSIRHNLSLNKSFVKVEREANIPGKGGWWAISQGHEDRFKDGLYSAGGAAGASGGASSKKKRPAKSASEQTPQSTPLGHVSSGSQFPGGAAEMTFQATASLPRKRTATNDSEASAPSPMAGGSKAAGDVKLPKAKSAKKAKMTAAASGNVLSDITNRSSVPDAHYNNFFTPARTFHHQQQPYMTSSSSGMPMLTDSEQSPPPSSPPAAAMFGSDVMMPPPPPSTLSKSKAARRGSQMMGHSGVVNATGQFGQENVLYFPQGGMATNNVGNNGSFYSSQPSPLAGRLRGSGHLGSSGSPLRRTNSSNDAPTTMAGRVMSPSKLGGRRGGVIAAGHQFSPVSSVRGGNDGEAPRNDTATSSSLASALGGPSSATRRSSLARTGSGNGIGRRGAMDFSPQRNDSPNRVTFSIYGANGASTPAHGQASYASPAGVSMQAAMSSGSMMSGGGAGAGYTGMTNHLTPTRITPTHTSTAIFKGHPHVMGANGMTSTSTPTGVSPSPNSRRYAANAAGSVNNATWLEDPFDYQGALQHEFDAINHGTGGNSYMS